MHKFSIKMEIWCFCFWWLVLFIPFCGSLHVFKSNFWNFHPYYARCPTDNLICLVEFRTIFHLCRQRRKQHKDPGHLIRPSVCPSVPISLSLQLLWNYLSVIHETWYVVRTSYVVLEIARKCCSSHFCGSYGPWNLENTHNDLVSATPLKLLIRFSWNLVCG